MSCPTDLSKEERLAIEAKHKRCGYCSGWGFRAVEDDMGVEYFPCPYGDENE